MPAPANIGGRDAHGSGPQTKTVMHVPYDSAQTLALVPSESDANTARDDDFFKDDDIKLYYAGDFCSPRLPGVEAAALSAVSVTNVMCCAILGATLVPCVPTMRPYMRLRLPAVLVCLLRQTPPKWTCEGGAGLSNTTRAGISTP